MKYRLFDGDRDHSPRAWSRTSVSRAGDAADHGAALHRVTDRGGPGPAWPRSGTGSCTAAATFTAPTVIDDEVRRRRRAAGPAGAAAQPGQPGRHRGGPQAAARRAAGRRLRHRVPQHDAARAAATLRDRRRDWPPRTAVRRYGFHGTSHAYVSRRTAALLGRPLADGQRHHPAPGQRRERLRRTRRAQRGHLDGPDAAGRAGDGHPQRGHRPGRDLPSAPGRRDVRWTRSTTLLNKRAGLLGLCGDNDMRAVESRREAGDEPARLAFDVYCHRLREVRRRLLRACSGRVDAITFTAGVGENDAGVRAEALAGLERHRHRARRRPERRPPQGRAADLPGRREVAVCVIPTDEEFEIAEEARAVVGIP